MKQIIFVLLLIIALNANAYERKSDTTLHVGVSSGMAYSTLRNYFNNFDYRLGYTFNAFVEYQPTREYAIRAGIGFTNKGFRNTGTFENSNGYSFDTIQNISLSYLNIPIDLNYHFGRRFNPYIGVGANINILLHARQYALLPETYNNASVDPFDITIQNTYRNVELSIHYLAGIEYRIKPNISMFVEAKYNYGITKIFKGDNITVGNRVKNNCITGSIGLKIGIPIKYVVDSPSI